MDQITITRSARRTTISIMVNPDATVSVVAPKFCPAWSIKKFIKDNEEWINKKTTEMRLRNQNGEKKTDQLWYLGKKYAVKYRQNKLNIIEFDDGFYIASTNQARRKTYLVSWYKQQSRTIIQKRLHTLNLKAQMQFNSVQITEAETRWGSCSTDKNLHFNWKLIMAPIAVIDYVIAHELAHLVEMNHTRNFWRQVGKIFPVYRQYRTWLRRYGHLLKI